MSVRRSFGADRWRENWRVVAPASALRFDVPLRSASAAAARARALPPGTPVVLAAAGPGAMGRCRAFASRGGIELDLEYLAIPSARRPACLVESAPGPVRAFLERVLVAPHGTMLDPLVELGVVALRAASPWRIVRALAPGRIVVGVRR